MSLDQGLLSALSLLVNLVLIHLGTKVEYAFFSMVMSVVLLTQSVQNAAICTPWITFSNRMARTEFPAFMSHLRRINGAAALVAALICGGVVMFVVRDFSPPAAGLAFGTIVVVLGVWFRESRRVRHLRRGEFRALVTSDLVVTVLVVSGLGLLMASGRSFTAADVLLVLGLANLLVSARELVPEASSVRASKTVVGDWTKQVRWSVSWTTFTWLQASSYPLLAAMSAGTVAAAEVAAARLFIAPGLLLGTAWGRLGLLQVTDAIRVGEGLKRFVIEHAALVGLAALAYCALVVLALLFGAGRALGNEYQNPVLVWCWLLVGLVTMIRSVASMALQAATAFSQLMKWGVVSAVVSCASVLALGSFLGGKGIILGLAVGEALQCVAFFRVVLRAPGGAVAAHRV